MIGRYTRNLRCRAGRIRFRANHHPWPIPAANLWAVSVLSPARLLEETPA